MESEKTASGKFSLERILLILALGGNISLGGIIGLSATDKEKEEDVDLTTCKIELMKTKLELLECKKEQSE